MDLLIKQYLKSQGKDLNTLATLMHKSQPAISLQVNGNPRASSLDEMAKALGCSVADFFLVPDGYVHWTQKVQHDALVARCEALEQRIAELESERTALTDGSKWRCPNCGMALQVIEAPQGESSQEE